MSCRRKERETPELLINFRTLISDILRENHDDNYLLRWLRARNYDLAQAETMLRNHMKWREQVGADTLLSDWTPPEVLVKFWPGGLFGSDKEGCPIWIEPVGLTDIKGLLSSAKKSDIIRFKICHCEQINHILTDCQIKEKHDNNKNNKKGTSEGYSSANLFGRPIGIVIIVDFEHFGLKHLWKPAMNLYTELCSMWEANYPETLKKVFVVNAPSIFSLVYSIVKPFISEDTKKKIHLLRGNWKRQLLQDIDADQLPMHWGGSCMDIDGDPYCSSKVHMGGEVDRSCYISNCNSLDHTTFTKVSIQARHSIKIPVSIIQTGSVIRWQFMTADYDIAFGIDRKPLTSVDDDNADDVIRPISRCNSHMVPEEGSIVCSKLGTYIVNFDNTHSWTTKKKLWYQIDVIPPNTTQ